MSELHHRRPTTNGSANPSDVLVVDHNDQKDTEKQAACEGRCDVCSSIAMALLVRFIFALHSCFAIWRVVSIYDERYFLLLITVAPWLVELIVTFVQRKGKEWPYFSPCLLAYLILCIPSIWLIELKRTSDTRAGIPLSTNSTLYGLNQPIPLGDFEWAIALEQSLMCLLIIGKWLLPRGSVSKDQLSQVLLVYLALAADMVDLFELLGEEEIYSNESMVYGLLSIWTWSMIQFTLALATTRGSSLNFDDDEEEEEKRREKLKQNNSRCKTYMTDLEVWAILVTMFMQDGPYFAYRVVAIAVHQVKSYTNYFFTAKNFLFLALQTYRLCVVVCPCCSEMQDMQGNNGIPTGLGVAAAMQLENHDPKKDDSVVGSPSSPELLRASSALSMTGFNVTSQTSLSIADRRKRAMNKLLAASRQA